MARTTQQQLKAVMDANPIDFAGEDSDDCWEPLNQHQTTTDEGGDCIGRKTALVAPSGNEGMTTTSRSGQAHQSKNIMDTIVKSGYNNDDLPRECDVFSTRSSLRELSLQECQGEDCTSLLGMRRRRRNKAQSIPPTPCHRPSYSSSYSSVNSTKTTESCLLPSKPSLSPKQVLHVPSSKYRLIIQFIKYFLLEVTWQYYNNNIRNNTQQLLRYCGFVLLCMGAVLRCFSCLLYITITILSMTVWKQKWWYGLVNNHKKNILHFLTNARNMTILLVVFLLIGFVIKALQLRRGGGGGGGVVELLQTIRRKLNFSKGACSTLTNDDSNHHNEGSNGRRQQLQHNDHDVTTIETILSNSNEEKKEKMRRNEIFFLRILFLFSILFPTLFDVQTNLFLVSVILLLIEKPHYQQEAAETTSGVVISLPKKWQSSFFNGGDNPGIGTASGNMIIAMNLLSYLLIWCAVYLYVSRHNLYNIMRRTRTFVWSRCVWFREGGSIRSTMSVQQEHHIIDILYFLSKLGLHLSAISTCIFIRVLCNEQSAYTTWLSLIGLFFILIGSFLISITSASKIDQQEAEDDGNHRGTSLSVEKTVQSVEENDETRKICVGYYSAAGSDLIALAVRQALRKILGDVFVELGDKIEEDDMLLLTMLRWIADYWSNHCNSISGDDRRGLDYKIGNLVDSPNLGGDLSDCRTRKNSPQVDFEKDDVVAEQFGIQCADTVRAFPITLEASNNISQARNARKVNSQMNYERDSVDLKWEDMSCMLQATTDQMLREGKTSLLTLDNSILLDKSSQKTNRQEANSFHRSSKDINACHIKGGRIQNLKLMLASLDIDAKAKPAIMQYKACVNSFAPSKETSLMVALMRRCPGWISLMLFSVLHPNVAHLALVALLPILLVECEKISFWSRSCHAKQSTLNDGDYHGHKRTMLMVPDTMDAMTTVLSRDDGTAYDLLRVWQNIEQSVIALERGLTVARCVQTTAHAAEFAENMVSLARMSHDLYQAGWMYSLRTIVEEIFHWNESRFTESDDSTSRNVSDLHQSSENSTYGESGGQGLYGSGFVAISHKAASNWHSITKNVGVLQEETEVFVPIVFNPVTNGISWLFGRGWLWQKRAGENTICDLASPATLEQKQASDQAANTTFEHEVGEENLRIVSEDGTGSLHCPAMSSKAECTSSEEIGGGICNCAANKGPSSSDQIKREIDREEKVSAIKLNSTEDRIDGISSTKEKMRDEADLECEPCYKAANGFSILHAKNAPSSCMTSNKKKTSRPFTTRRSRTALQSIESLCDVKNGCTMTSISIQKTNDLGKIIPDISPAQLCHQADENGRDREKEDDMWDSLAVSQASHVGNSEHNRSTVVITNNDNKDSSSADDTADMLSEGILTSVSQQIFSGGGSQSEGSLNTRRSKGPEWNIVAGGALAVVSAALLGTAALVGKSGEDQRIEGMKKLASTGVRIEEVPEDDVQDDVSVKR